MMRRAGPGELFGAPPTAPAEVRGRNGESNAGSGSTEAGTGATGEGLGSIAADSGGDSGGTGLRSVSFSLPFALPPLAPAPGKLLLPAPEVAWKAGSGCSGGDGSRNGNGGGAPETVVANENPLDAGGTKKPPAGPYRE